MKQIFIIHGEPATGKSILFREAARVNLFNLLDYMFYLRIIDKYDIKSLLIDDFIVTDKNCKDLVVTIDRFYKEKLDYLIIITNCRNEDLHKLTDRLKMLNIPISVCEMKRCE